MSGITQNQDYKNWLTDLKANIKSTQIKAALAVNSSLIQLYWEMGRQIVEKQEHAKWGSGFIEQLSKDLKAEFPDMGGFSVANIKYCRQFYLFYFSQITESEQAVRQIQSDESPIVQQVVSQLQITDNQNIKKSQQLVGFLPDSLFQIPWGHNILIFSKIKDVQEAIFYVQQTIENNWSRAVLEYQIEINLYQRQGKAITNFKNTLPEPDSDLANALLKDTYNFEFLTLSSKVKELDLEQKLIENITKFLLELGKGFAYMGRQFELNVGGEIFRTDLLFYHTKLKCYVVIELKVTKFKPEYIGKLSFYLTAVDRLIKDDHDKPTIGILLCKTKNDVVVDFALHDTQKPVGVSEYTYKELPEGIKNALPSIEQLTQQLEDED
jgi:predicted nuclease of restriction endonuclease-like (RecB) superfamily